MVFSACSLLFFLSLTVLFTGPARGAEEPGAGAVREQQIWLQQQQDELQLRMQQQQRSLQSPRAGSRERQEREQLEIKQRQRQQELHYRQKIEPPVTHPDYDAGVRRAKAEMDRQRAKEEGERQLRRFDSGPKDGMGSGDAGKARGEVPPPGARELLQ